MKIIFSTLFLLAFYFSKAQPCDTVVVIKSFDYDNGTVTRLGFSVSPFQNGQVVDTSLQFYYDTLQRPIAKVRHYIYGSDSTAYFYDSLSRIYERDYFTYSQYFNSWEYMYDTARSVNFYNQGGKDSAFVRYKWNGYSLTSFYQILYYYSNNILGNWVLQTNNGSGFVTDSTFNVYYQSGYRTDSGYAGNIKPQFYDAVYKYDPIYGLFRTESLFAGMADGYTDYFFQCGQSAGYTSSGFGWLTAGGTAINFDSLCMIKYIQKWNSGNQGYTFTQGNYFYADCNHLVPATSLDSSICKGDSTTITVECFGGHKPYRAQWTPSTGLASDTSFHTKVSPDSTTTYFVTVTDSLGLTTTDSVIVLVTNPPYSTLHIQSIDSTSTCHSAILSTDSIDNFTYTWFFENERFGLGTANKFITSNGEYVVFISSGNVCPGIYDTILVNAIPHPTPQLNLIHGCGYIVAVTNEPCQFQWSSNYSFTYGLTQDTIYVSSVGEYFVIAIDSNGCQSEQRKMYYYYQSPFIAKQSSCIDSCNGWLSAFGGYYAYYQWNTGDTTELISNLCPGVYTVTIQDGYGCDTTLQDTLTAFPEIDFTILSTGTSSSPTCDGFAMVIDSSNTPYGHYVTWEDSTNDFLKDSLCSGWNYFYVTSNYTGCPQYDSVFVNSSHSTDTCTAQINITNNLCNGQALATASVSLPSGHPYGCIWQIGNSFHSYDNTINNLPQGNYTCIVIDSTGCVDTIVASVVDPLPINATYSVFQSPCYDSCSVSLNVSGGSSPYSYSWCNGDNQFVSNNCNAFCGVTITDANGCYASFTTFQPQINPLSMNFSVTPATCPTCSNGVINISANGGSPPYNYSIDTTFVGSNQVISNLSPGTYDVCVYGSDSCMYCNSVSVTFLIGVDEIADNLISVYPNPAHEMVKIVLAKEMRNAVYELTDYLGRIVASGHVAEKEFLIDTHYLTGNYLLRILSDDRMVRKKILVMN